MKGIYAWFLTWTVYRFEGGVYESDWRRCEQYLNARDELQDVCYFILSKIVYSLLIIPTLLKSIFKLFINLIYIDIYS